MLQSTNDNKEAVMRLARHLTNDAETSCFQPSPYITKILRKVFDERPDAIDLIVYELIREASNTEPQDKVEILREFLTSSKRKTLFDFLKGELNRLAAWSSDHADYKKDLKLLFKGVVLILAEQYEAAKIYFEKALQIDPTSVMGLYGKALALKSQGMA